MASNTMDHIADQIIKHLFNQTPIFTLITKWQEKKLSLRNVSASVNFMKPLMHVVSASQDRKVFTKALYQKWHALFKIENMWHDGREDIDLLPSRCLINEVTSVRDRLPIINLHCSQQSFHPRPLSGAYTEL